MVLASLTALGGSFLQSRRLMISYTWYYLKHKYYVLCYGLQFGLGGTQLVLHDLDKLKDHKRFATAFVEGYDVGLAHRSTQLHHYEHWNGKKIPQKYLYEMLADWLSAAKCKTGDKYTVKNWYNENKEKINLHPVTRDQVESLLNCLN